MAIVRKIKSRRSLSMACKHNERNFGAKGYPEHIDATKTHLNKEYMKRKWQSGKEVSPLEYFDYRINQLWCLNRKDVARAFEWVLTLPPTVTDEKEIDLFWAGFAQYLFKTYGKENVMSIIVHHEEHSVHAHALILPVVKNDKKSKNRPQDEKISAKEVLTKQHLKDWHGNLEKFLLEKKGLSVKLRTGKTKAQGGNRNYYHEKKHSISRERPQIERNR